MSMQSPLKVRPATKERIRYLAALEDVAQADLVDRAVTEYAARHADDIARGMARAREVLAAGDIAIAAHLLDVPAEAIARVAGQSPSAT